MPKGTSGRGGSGGGSGGGGGGEKKPTKTGTKPKPKKKEASPKSTGKGQTLSGENKRRVVDAGIAHVNARFKAGDKSVSINSTIKHVSKQTGISEKSIRKALTEDHRIMSRMVTNSKAKRVYPSRDVSETVHIKQQGRSKTRGYSHFSKE